MFLLVKELNVTATQLGENYIITIEMIELEVTYF